MKSFFKKSIKAFRKKLTFWMSKNAQEFLKKIREYELQQIINKFPKNCKILEIGGGSGWQGTDPEGREVQLYGLV